MACSLHPEWLEFLGDEGTATEEEAWSSLRETEKAQLGDLTLQDFRNLDKNDLESFVSSLPLHRRAAFRSMSRWPTLKHPVWRTDEEVKARFTALMVQGVPKELRPRIWSKLASGSKSCVGPSGAPCQGPRPSVHERYQALCDRFNTSEWDRNVGLDIDKDVHRTFANREEALALMGPDVLDKLRRILRAYSLHNPAVGYCQGLNFIAGALLEVISEEAITFDVFASMVDAKSSYYTSTITGALVDSRVLSSLLSYTDPLLFQKLVAKATHLNSLCSSWLFCLYMQNPLSLQLGIRFWDLYLLRGEEMLFRFGLHLFRYHRELISRAQTAEDVMDIFLRKLGDIPEEQHGVFLKGVFDDINEEVLAHIPVLRELHRYDVIREQLDLSGGTKRRLAKTTYFTGPELEIMWKSYLAPDPWLILTEGGITSVINFQLAFCECAFPLEQRQWKDQWKDRATVSGVMDRLFTICSTRSTIPVVSFQEFLCAMSKFLKSRRSERLRVAFNFCDVRGTNELGKEDLLRAIQMFDHMFNGLRDKCQESEVFVEMVFERLHSTNPAKHTLDFSSFCTIAYLHPLLSKFFRLEVETPVPSPSNQFNQQHSGDSFSSNSLAREDYVVVERPSTATTQAVPPMSRSPQPSFGAPGAAHGSSDSPVFGASARSGSTPPSSSSSSTSGPSTAAKDLMGLGVPPQLNLISSGIRKSWMGPMNAVGSAYRKSKGERERKAVAPKNVSIAPPTDVW